MAKFEKLTAPSQGTQIRFENGQPVVACLLYTSDAADE